MSPNTTEKAAFVQKVRSILVSSESIAVDEAEVPASRTSRPCPVKGISYPATDIPFLAMGKVLETSMALVDHHPISSSCLYDGRETRPKGLTRPH